MKTLLSEDEHGIRKLLSDAPAVKTQAYMQERSLEEETPLHVAVCWPRGLKLLFEFGGYHARGLVNSVDARGSTPLLYALGLHIHDSVKILLDNGAQIELENTAHISCFRMKPWCSPQSADIIILLCLELARRRREMCNLAMEYMSPTEIEHFKLKENEMLQENAYDVMKMLQVRQYKLLPRFGNVRPGSLYHSSGVSLHLAESLIQVGFNEPNSLLRGYSPLMTLNAHAGVFHLGMWGYMGLVEWFLRHENDLYAPYPASACMGGGLSDNRARCFRTAHHVAYNLGARIRSCQWEWDQSWRSLLVEVMSEDITDPCECSCTAKNSSGCTPASLYTRGMLDCGITRHAQCSGTWDDTFSMMHLHMGVGFASMAVQESEAIVGRTIAMQFIRSCTFSRLGMKHTCCKYRYNDPHVEMPTVDANGQPFIEGGNVT